VIWAFDHEHVSGDICSRAVCEHARRAPVLAGSEVFDDMPMTIVRSATRREYLTQPIPKGWCIPPLIYGCTHLYEVSFITRTSHPDQHPTSIQPQKEEKP
jgi:hypothetical protein